MEEDVSSDCCQHGPLSIITVMSNASLWGTLLLTTQSKPRDSSLLYPPGFMSVVTISEFPL